MPVDPIEIGLFLPSTRGGSVMAATEPPQEAPTWRLNSNVTRMAEEAGLEEVDDLFKKLQEGLDKLQTKEKLDRKEAMVKLNDLAQDLAKKRDELANVDQMRKQLDQLKNFQPGPGDKFGKALKGAIADLNLEIVKRSDIAKGFVALPKRWVVERTLAWLNRCRRLAKDWECPNRRAQGFLLLASVRLMVHRLCQEAG